LAVSLSRDPPVSDYSVPSVTDRNESDGGFTFPVTTRNVNNAVVAADDSFVTMVMKKTEVRKEMSNTVIQPVKKNRPLKFGVKRSYYLSAIKKMVKAKYVFVS
jgi:hypothetical protein